MSIVIKEIIVKTTIEQKSRVNEDEIYRRLKEYVLKEIEKKTKQKVERNNR